MIQHITDKEQVKAILKSVGSYVHSKTGNIYTHYGVVIPLEFPDQIEAEVFFEAYDSENKDVVVKVYKGATGLFYIPSENPDFTDNGELKVLYCRGDCFWMRTETMFHEVVEVNGIKTPRFKRVNKS